MKPAILMALLTTPGFSQVEHPATEIESPFANRVANLNKKFAELLQPPAIEKQWRDCPQKANCANATQMREQIEREWAERLKAINAVASQIRNEIDAYVARAVDANRLDSAAVAQSLERILGGPPDERPSAFVLDLDHAQSLIIAYTVFKGTLMGTDGTSVTLRAYTPSRGTLRLVAATGDDMDGYAGVSVLELHSPVPHEMWLLLSGYMTGANGPNNRMRVYAYDGSKFRIMWAPENIWGNFTLDVTDRGFTVDGDYYREDKIRHDEYVLAEDGVYHAAR
jgi:hypothetical protein